MKRTYHTFQMLQATAFVVMLAIIFWSLGLPTFRFAEAANVTSFSDTISDSAPSTGANHTIVFTTPTGVAASETIVITFDNNFDLGVIGTDDIDVATTTGELTLVDDGSEGPDEWGVATSSNTITLTSGGASATIGAYATVTIEVGTHASTAGAGDAQITNPGTPGSYSVNVSSGSQDSGETVVAIVDTVTVSASVDTTFSFTVRGLAPGSDVNGDTTTGSTTPTAISFGQLESGTASTAGQQLEVSTNAANGYVVTVQVDQQLLSSTGADIDGFSDGTYVEIPSAWSPPSGTIGQEATYGHWGLTTEDATTTRAAEFDAQEYVSASTTPIVIMSHDGPAAGTGTGVGIADIGYRVEISALQEAANDYTSTLTYVATPVF